MADLQAGAQKRLSSYLERVGDLLGNPKRRAGFAAYAVGLLSQSERKSVEPIAALLCPDPKKVDAAHQRLLHFVGQSKWQDAPVRQYAAGYGLEEMTKREPVETWIFDDTGFLKQGKHSVGVQRQYTGSAGKITNCQIGVSLTAATSTMQLPVDFELYLPRSWTDDPERRHEAKIPKNIDFRTKPALALAMAKRAVAAGLPPGLVLADAAYGNNGNFRVGLRQLGLPYAVDIEGSTKVCVGGARGKAGRGISARELALSLGIRAYRRVSWREGSKRELWSWFACRRVFIPRDAKRLGKRENVWLLVEWPPEEDAPTKFTLLTLPKSTRIRSLVRVSRQRWRTERVYEDLKGELGLDHFEGRSFAGWHHHVTVALSCYAFAAAEQARAFPPSARRPRRRRPNAGAARASLRRFPDHRASRGHTRHRLLVSALPNLPAHATKAPLRSAAVVTQ
jgi:SRSO17 transposase